MFASALLGCASSVLGALGLYIRFPSNKEDAIIHRISDVSVTTDWLSERNKTVYGKWLTGDKNILPADHDDSLSHLRGPSSWFDHFPVAPRANVQLLPISQ